MPGAFLQQDRVATGSVALEEVGRPPPSIKVQRAWSGFGGFVVHGPRMLVKRTAGVGSPHEPSRPSR
jgi:hypothetical protein